ncbi:MAG: cadherin repeat domain-containing protein, partial [Bacteroidales bacterium]|nr:cadherin repeat domain-containing protein [Bacteroidales bacterium]
EVAYNDKANVSKLTDEANGEVKLYAKWTINSYTVTLPDYLTLTTIPEDNKYQFRTPITFKVKDNYQVEGLKYNGVTLVKGATGTYTIKVPGDVVPEDFSCDVIKQLFIVTFEVEGKDPVKKQIPESETPSYGETNPTKESTATHSYKFVGWKNGDAIYSINENGYVELPAVTENVTYTAQFDETVNCMFVDTKNNSLFNEDGTLKPITYDGEDHKPTLVVCSAVKVNDEFPLLISGVDYEITMPDEMKAAGSYDITITSKNATVQTCPDITKTLEIKPRPVKVVIDKDKLSSTYGETVSGDNIVWSVSDETPLVEGESKSNLGLTFISDAFSTADNPADYQENGYEIQAIVDNKNYVVTFEPKVEDISWTINKKPYDQPKVSDFSWKDETVSGLNDGVIDGVNSSMEYSVDGGEYKPIKEEQTKLENLAPGKYAIRIKGDNNHEPSEAVTITIKSGVNTYTITFVDGDGKTLQTSTVKENELPEYTSTATPTKTATAKYSYEFNGEWSPEIVAATADATYTAQFDEVLRSYTITFVIDNDASPKVTVKETFKYGEMPKYEGSYKQSTDEFSFEFTGWDRKFVEVTGYATYTAKYNKVINCFAANNLDNVDYDGSEHKPQITVHSVESDNFIFTIDEDYTLEWSSDLKNAGTVTATITGINDYEGCPVVTKSFEISRVTYAEPTGLSASDETISQKKDGKISGVNSSMEYSNNGVDFKEIGEGVNELTDLAPGSYSIRVKADRNHIESLPVILEIKASDTKLKVKFVNYEDSQLTDELRLDYNNQVSYPGNEPVKDLNDGYAYTFIGWKDNFGNTFDKNAELPNATRNVTYTALFSDRDNVKPEVKSVTANDTEILDKTFECIGSALVKIKAEDDNSGIDKITYIINGGEAQEYENPFSIEPGTYTISVTATDKAGNPSESVVVKAVVRQEASFPQDASYTYTQLSKKDVVLEGIDLSGATIATVTIDGKEYENLVVQDEQDGNKVTLKSDVLDNVTVGEHKLQIYTVLNDDVEHPHDTKATAKLTVNGFKVDFQQSGEKADGYCNDETAAITLTFDPMDKYPTHYKIVGIHDKYQQMERLADEIAKVKVAITDNMPLVNGNLQIQFAYTDGTPNTESEVKDLSIKINGSSDLIIELFEDILAIDNHNDLYTAFQWYKDGVEIEEATQQYYQSQQLKGRYGAYVTTTDGKTLNICPIEVGESVSKSLKHSVNVYPNPARAYEEVTIELLNFADVEYEGCVIRIVNALGATAATINNCDRINTVSLPSGTYTGYVIRNGKDDKVSFKLIVK